MNILAKFKETAVSVLPVILIVLALGLTVAPLEKLFLLRFVISGLLLILGLTLFLLGVDLSIQPMGERAGAALTGKKSLALLLSVAFIIGFIVTAAEPDIQVFGDQVKGVFPFVNKSIFTFAIATGVGLFIMIGLLRTVLNLSLKITILISYIILFAVSFFVPQAFLGIAFDSGGATTGPMTVPFIMSLGIGVARVMAGKDENSSFGLTGIASVGPVLAVLIYGTVAAALIAEGGDATAAGAAASGIAAATVSSLIKNVFHEAILSILPIFTLFVIFQILHHF